MSSFDFFSPVLLLPLPLRLQTREIKLASSWLSVGLSTDLHNSDLVFILARTQLVQRPALPFCCAVSPPCRSAFRFLSSHRIALAALLACGSITVPLSFRCFFGWCKISPFYSACPLRDDRHYALFESSSTDYARCRKYSSRTRCGAHAVLALVTDLSSD